jgi:flagellar basal-body rod protein FlgB
VLAANLANADTPGYRARDIDFKNALAAASGQTNATGGVHLATTRAGHIGNAAPDGTPAPELKYRTPLAPSLDGNTVDGQLEQAAFAENTVRYQATLSFISSKFRALMTAITGQ